jgi:amidohydrolase
MEAHKRMKKLAEELAKSMGGTCEFNIMKGYPVLINEENITRSARHHAEEFLGKENVESLQLWTAAEDFASYSQIIPGCFYRLGIRNESKGIISPVHTSTFDIDETALETGMGLMAWLALMV